MIIGRRRRPGLSQGRPDHPGLLSVGMITQGSLRSAWATIRASAFGTSRKEAEIDDHWPASPAGVITRAIIHGSVAVRVCP